MNMKSKSKTLATMPARAVYFLALVGIVAGYVLWTRKDQFGMLFIDIGLLLSLIATIMYPLLSAP